MSHVDAPTQALLHLRAAELANRGQVEVRRSVGEPVAVFVVGGERLAVPVTHLVSVIRLPPITAMPELPSWMPGIVQVRGTLLTVIDISRWLGLPQQNAPAYLAMLEESRRPLGILVDGVAGVRDIFADEIAEQHGWREGDRTLPVQFTTRDLVAVVDVVRLFAAMDQRRTRPTGAAPLLPLGDRP